MTEIRPLPRLKVVRETYCSQKIVDDACDYLQEYHADKLLLVLEEERTIRISAFYIALDKHVVKYIKEEMPKLFPIPDNLIGLVDLTYEISRRLRSAYELPIVFPKGIPLKKTSNGKIQSLPSLAISDSAVRAGLTQKIVDAVLNESCQALPEVWFAFAEAVRTNIFIYPVLDPFLKNFEQLLLKFPTHEADKRRAFGLGQLKNEATYRIMKACEISEEDMQDLVKPAKHLIN